MRKIPYLTIKMVENEIIRRVIANTYDINKFIELCERNLFMCEAVASSYLKGNFPEEKFDILAEKVEILRSFRGNFNLREQTLQIYNQLLEEDKLKKKKPKKKK